MEPHGVGRLADHQAEQQQQQGSQELEEPLLRSLSDSDELSSESRLADNYGACVFNLTKALFGAGMMALPRACTLLGAYVGFGMLIAVGFITWWSIKQGLVHPADRLVRRHPAGRPDQALQGYSQLVRSYLGKPGAQLLNAFLLANSVGFSVMYIDVIGDVLLGSRDEPSMAVQLLEALALPEWLLSRLLLRPVFVGLLMLLVVVPISVERRIESLNALNALGLGALLALFASTAWLAAAAAASGAAHTVPLWPDWEALGRTGASSSWLAAAALLPVMLTADGCHINVMPLANMMKPWSARSMSSVAGASLALVTVFYVAFSWASYVIFGEALEEDVLKNLTPEAMQPLIGLHQARLVAFTVRAAYVMSLLGNTALNNFPLRDALLDAVYSGGPGKDAAKDKYFLPVTLGILFLVYLLAVSISSMWKVVGFVGGVASTGVCYLFPAALMFAYANLVENQPGKAKGMTRLRVGASAIMAIGSGILLNSLLHPMR